MSGATTLAYVAGAAVVGSMYMQHEQGRRAAKAQEAGQRQAAQQASAQADQAQKDFNRANQKAPDSRAALSAAAMSGRAGQSGTLLTGPQGVGQSALTLGRNSLLGS